MGKSYDMFSANILESAGYIEREAFEFSANLYEVWIGGVCVDKGQYSITITAHVGEGALYVTIANNFLNIYVSYFFNFSEISLSGDRILWSNDLMNGGFNTELREPSFMSLYYISRVLSKITLTIGNPNCFLEFAIDNTTPKNHNALKNLIESAKAKD